MFSLFDLVFHTIILHVVVSQYYKHSSGLPTILTSGHISYHPYKWTYLCSTVVLVDYFLGSKSSDSSPSRHAGIYVPNLKHLMQFFIDSVKF